MLNASGSVANTTTAGFYVNPILVNVATLPNLQYDTATYEITYNSSNRRFKTNIRPLNLNTSVIYDIQPMKFDAISKEAIDITGFIAEDLEAISTEFVIKNGDIMTPHWNTMLIFMLEELKKLRNSDTSLAASALKEINNQQLADKIHITELEVKVTEQQAIITKQQETINQIISRLEKAGL
jgi:hypothetical protein